jgi:hypothetical protein
LPLRWSSAFRSENNGSFGYDLKSGGFVSQQLWLVKELSLLKVINAKHMSKFAVLSPIKTVSQQVWQVKELSLLKVINAKHMSKFQPCHP